MQIDPCVTRRLVPALWLVLTTMLAGFAWGEVADSPGILPTPVVIAPAGPIDLWVSFDRPVDPASAAKLVGRSIDFDPGKRQQPGSLKIAGADLQDEGRTLHLATDPHPVAARYSLHAGGDDRWSYDLSGVEANWSEPGAEPESPPTWSGLLPTLDLEQARTRIKGSVLLDRGFELFQKAGQLTLSTLAAFPKGRIHAEVTSSGPIEEFLLGNEAYQAEEGGEPVRERSLTVDSAGESQFLLIRVRTPGGRFPTVKLTYRVDDAPASESLRREQMLLPWVPLPAPAIVETGATPASLAGGNAARGETLFYGDQAQCSRCHRVKGKGGEIGPDLSMVSRKGAAEIYRSIANPSAVIEPNYLAFTVSAKDGRVVAGVVRADGPDAILVNDTNAKSTRIARRDIDQIRPASASIMPVGLASALGEERVRDLIAFLTASGSRR